MRIINYFICIKNLDRMNEERLTCLIRNCDVSNVELMKLFQTLCAARS